MSPLGSALLLCMFITFVESSSHLESKALRRRRSLNHWNAHHQFINPVTTEGERPPLEIVGTDWVILCPDPDSSGKGYHGSRRKLKGNSSSKSSKSTKGHHPGKGWQHPGKGMQPHPPDHYHSYSHSQSRSSKSSGSYNVYPFPCIKVPIQRPTESPLATPTQAPDLVTLFPAPTRTPSIAPNAENATSVPLSPAPSSPTTPLVPSNLTIVPSAAPSPRGTTAVPSIGSTTPLPSSIDTVIDSIVPSLSAAPVAPPTVPPSGLGSATLGPTLTESPFATQLPTLSSAPAAATPSESPSFSTPPALEIPTRTTEPSLTLAPTSTAIPSLVVSTLGPSTNDSTTAIPSLVDSTLRPSTSVTTTAVPSGTTAPSLSGTDSPSAITETVQPTLASSAAASPTTTPSGDQDPTLVPSTSAPTEASAPTTELTVAGTPFGVELTTSATITPSVDDINEASTIIENYLLTYFTDVFSLTPQVVLIDFVATLIGNIPGSGATTLGYDAVATFTGDEEVMPSEFDVDILLGTALSPPRISTLITELGTLPSDNPFSTVTDIRYTTENVPSGAPPITGTSSTVRTPVENDGGVPTSFVAAVAATSIVLLGLAVAAARASRTESYQQHLMKHSYSIKTLNSNDSTEPCESGHEDTIEFLMDGSDRRSSMFDSPFVCSEAEEAVGEEDSYLDHEVHDPWLLQDY